MSDRCDLDRLEALVYGELEGAEAEALRRHAASCDACGRELSWLEKERALALRRADADEPMPESVWAGIEAAIAGDARAAEVTGAPPPRVEAVRAHRRRRSQRGARWIGIAAAGAAAAAALVLTLWPGGPEPGVAPQPVAETVNAADAAADAGDELAEARRAIAEAERAHVNAIDSLRVAYEARRDQLDPAVARVYDQRFQAAAELIDSASETAGDDIEARWLLLDAYAAHRRSLQGVLQEIQE